MRVLIVEDGGDLRDRLVELLSRQGMLVDGVACHDEAMAALSTTSFDLLLVDCALPDGEGLSPCEALRRPDGPGRQRSC